MAFYYLVVAIGIAGIVVVEFLKASRLGRTLRALADSPTAVESLGINPWANPNVPGTYNSSGPSGNYAYSPPSRTYFDDLNGRIDHQFNTTDVAIVVKTELITDKYYRHYERQLREALY